MGDLPLPVAPSTLVLEVVESVRADPAVLAGVRRLRAAGYRIAIDDFVALDDQLALLPYADYVKIDVRDLVRIGADLVVVAARHGARLIAERIEDLATLERCRKAGFILFQGDVLAPTVVVQGNPSIPSPRPS